jgi:hypothetical protein
VDANKIRPHAQVSTFYIKDVQGATINKLLWDNHLLGLAILHML